MIKPLIITLILVILLAIVVNINFSSSPIEHSSPLIQTKVSPKVKIEPIKIIIAEEKIIIKKEDNLSNEIQALFNQASEYWQKSQYDEAHNTYTLILKKIKNRTDVKFLKYFAEVYNQKSFLFRRYPVNDQEAAIEALEHIIEKFKDSNNTELVQLYIDASVQQSYLQTKEDTLDTYNRLIKKFEHKEEIFYKKTIEELLIAKSFLLMGENNDEAMELLDNLITKHQNSGEKNLPENIQISILNSIELSIITNSDDTNYRELAEKYMSNAPDTAPLLDMLEIVRNSQELNQDDALKEWKENYNNYRFPDWSFDELRKWAYNIEDVETKNRTLKYIDSFENHKYYVNEMNSRNRSESTISASTEHQEPIYEDSYKDTQEEEEDAMYNNDHENSEENYNNSY